MVTFHLSVDKLIYDTSGNICDVANYLDFLLLFTKGNSSSSEPSVHFFRIVVGSIKKKCNYGQGSTEYACYSNISV